MALPVRLGDVANVFDHDSLAQSGSDAWAGMTTRSERASALNNVTSRVPGRSMQIWS